MKVQHLASRRYTNSILTVLCFLLLICTFSNFTTAEKPAPATIGTHDYTGAISLFALDYVPTGYSACDGSAFDVTQNQALGSLIAFQWGHAPGNQNMANYPKIPDLKGKDGGTVKYCIRLQGSFPSR